MRHLLRIIKFLSTIADTPNNSAEERRQHSFLIYIGMFMSSGGLVWGTIALFSGLPYQAMIPYGYGVITIFNFTYLYYSKNFQFSQALQLLISLLLPFMFQLSLGGFVSSGAQVFWAITAILGAFTFKENKSIIVWFILYIVLVILSGIFDADIREMNFIEVPPSISILFFVINITAVSLIIFSLFYYFVGSERNFRESLHENLETLKNAQDQLVESEKMSALGGLVAGVAHEVNTPLGISITAASIFKNKIKKLEKSIKENTLSKTDLDDFIHDLSDADDILIKNLDRAALLIKNFKKISVDQSSEEVRKFELNSYIEEVISTFKSELRHHEVTLQLNLHPEPIQMHSYPGDIAQMIINLLQNSIVHAFEESNDKYITLTTQVENGTITLMCCDNGKGIHSDVEARVFEPFVTTKRNKGGTGLGLNITYNLVTQHLGGSIKLDTEYQEGARFIITLDPDLTKKENYSI